MTKREYIGARYVPKMFEHNGSNEWVSGIAYEPLMVVSYSSVSYTSKKPVPSNIGSPNQNPEYWVVTGDYSGMYNALDARIDVVEEKSVVTTPEMYGAVGDGETDDTLAVQQCINNAPVHSTVVMKGHYKITSSININKPLTISGNYSGFDIEESTSIVTNAEYQKCTLIFTNGGILVNSVGVTIRDMGIYSTGTSANANVIKFTNMNDVSSSTHISRNNRVVNVMIWGNSANITNGIGCDDDIITTTFEQVRIYGCVNGFNIGSDVRATTSLTFINCWVINCTGVAYKLKKAGYCTFISCACDNATNQMVGGYEFDTCNTICVLGCGIEGTSTYGLKLISSIGIFVSGSAYNINMGNSNSGGFCVVKDSSVELNGCKVYPNEHASKRLINVIDESGEHSKFTIHNCAYTHIRNNNVDVSNANKDYNGMILQVSRTITTGGFGEFATSFTPDNYLPISGQVTSPDRCVLDFFITSDSKIGGRVRRAFTDEAIATTQVTVDLLILDKRFALTL